MSMHTVFVGNLSYQTRSDALGERFAAFGTVVSARIALDPVGRSRGFGFVEMASAQQAHAAIERADGQVLAGRVMSVRPAVAIKANTGFIRLRHQRHAPWRCPGPVAPA